MISHIQLCSLLAVFSYVISDYHSDFSDHSAVSNYNTYYPDYSYAYNYSNPSGYKRIFTEDYTLTASASITLDITIPIPDLDTEVYITVPLSYDFPTSSSRSLSGRSFSSGTGSPRASIYKSLEGYIAQVTRSDGHACLLRAMCETSAYPLHDEGVLGDAVNFLLTASYSEEETDHQLKHYVAAQAKGQLSGDCSTYNKECPKSLFELIDDIHFK